MADRGRDLVFCHGCENEWYRDEHGLECPECHSDVVEIIEPDSDPREEDSLPGLAEALRHGSSQPPPIPPHPNQHPFHNHDPWQHDDSFAPDPDEGDIDNVHFSGSGFRYSSTTFMSGPGGIHHHSNSGNLRAADIFPQIMGSMLGGQANRIGAGQQSQPPRSQDAYAEQDSRSPLQEGSFRMGSSPRGNASIRVATSGFGAGPTVQHIQSDDLMGIFGSILQGVGGAGPGPHATMMGGRTGARGDNGPPNPLGFLAQMLDPANARSGDAVYTNEALDRIISQLMEQHTASSAPGPASEGAINSLPTIKITKEQLDESGKAECSICMESCETGAEVTELPCKHWFHGECVSAWLREHDTCPQCRRGIMPKEGDQNIRRETGQQPRFWQMPQPGSNPTSPTAEASGSGHERRRSNDEGSEGGHPRRSPPHSGHSSGFTSGIAGLMDRLRPRGSRDEHSHGGHSHRGHSHESSSDQF